MADLLERHRNKLIALMTVLGIAALVWLDDTRGALEKGTDAPAFALQVLGEERKVTLAELRGQPAVLDFWATWCGPCQASLPKLDALSKTYAGRARFFAINAESESTQLQEAFRARLGLTMPILPAGVAAARLFEVNVLPTTVILDRDGKVAQTFTGARDDATIAKAIDQLL